MTTKISQGQEKYIIKICELAKQEERVRILGLIDEMWANSDVLDYKELKARITK